MASVSAAFSRTAKVLGLVGTAHYMSHVFYLALPPLFPLVARELDVSYTALGLVMTAHAIASAVCATPMGFVVDRLGGRRVLIFGLTLQAAAICAVGLTSSYWGLLALYLFAGMAFSVYHPADYAILSASVEGPRLGRAFSIHAFSGNLGSASVPMIMVALTALWDWRTAFVAIGVFGLGIALILVSQGELLVDDAERARRRRNDDPSNGERAAGPQPLREQLKVLMVPSVLMCFFFYVISHLGLGGLRTYAVSGLVALYGTPLAAANGALTGFLLGSSAGILIGGVIADRLGPRMITACAGLIGSAALMLLIGNVSMPIAVIVALLAMAGLMRGVVQATRDLVVLSVTPRGSTGKVFAFVTNGSMVGGAIMPLVFGWVMDRGEPGWVFSLTAMFMLFALVTFFGVKQITASEPGNRRNGSY